MKDVNETGLVQGEGGDFLTNSPHSLEEMESQGSGSSS